KSINSHSFRPYKIFRKYCIHPQALLRNHSFLDLNIMGRPKGAKNRRTLLREAEADIAHAKDGTDILDCLYVMETGMRYFFMRAQAARNVKGNEAVVRANMLEAVSIAERIGPYRHHRLAAIKVDAKDLKPRDGQKSLEQLRAQMQKHWERLAPVLDLEALIAPSDGIEFALGALRNCRDNECSSDSTLIEGT